MPTRQISEEIDETLRRRRRELSTWGMKEPGVEEESDDRYSFGNACTPRGCPDPPWVLEMAGPEGAERASRSLLHSPSSHAACVH